MAAPTFVDGQVMSAAFHLNGLQRTIQELRDKFLGYQMPFTGGYGVDRWTGIIRHRYNTLYYSVQTFPSTPLPAYLKINNITVVTINGTDADTVSLASLSLTEGEFYTVELVGSNVSVRMLYETYTPTLPTLVSFAADTVPTAAEWQDLSDYADALADLMDAPQPTGLCNNGPVTWAPGKTVYLGTFDHRCRYLAYHVWLQRPYNTADDGGRPWIEGYLRIDGTDVWMRRVHDNRATSDPGGVDFGQDNAVDMHYVGLLDLDTYPGTLNVGDTYELTLYVETNTNIDTMKDARLWWAYEAPAGDEAIAGWTDFAVWNPGNYVWGDSNPYTPARNVATIKDNMELLGSLAVYRNYPSRERNVLDQLYGVRRKRFLHYRNDEEDSPSIAWTFNDDGEDDDDEQESGLPSAKDQWLALDLESLERFYPGTRYKLTGVKYAIEDDYA